MNRVYKWYLRMHNSNYAFIRRFIEVMLPLVSTKNFLVTSLLKIK